MRELGWLAGALILFVSCAKGADGGFGGAGGNGGETPGTGGKLSGTGGIGSSSSSSTGLSTTSSSGGGLTTSSSGGASGTGGFSASGGGGAGMGGIGGTVSGSGGMGGTGGGTGGSGGGGGAPPCTTNHLVISEIKTRGAQGGNDEFVELFNPTNSDVTLDSTWKINARSIKSSSYSVRWTGGGGVIPALGHFLIGGSSYAGPPSADEALSTGITDAGGVMLVNNGTTIDTVCFSYSSSQTFASSFMCAGTPVSNKPHNDGGGATSNVDESIERKNGDCQDTGNNATDFKSQKPSTPKSSTSP